MTHGDLSTEAKARYQFVRKLLACDFSPPASVVELGAAPGDQIASLAHDGYSTTAVDIGLASDEWADGSEGRMVALLDAAGVEAVTWDLEKTPYPLPSDHFDAVIMTDVFEHLRDYPIRSLMEVRRILRPSGRLYFTTPNAAYVMNRLRALRGRSIATPLEDWIGGLPHARHAREYTCEEVATCMSFAGLRIRLMTSRHFYRDQGSGTSRLVKTIIDRIARLRPKLGPLIIVVAEVAP